MQTKHPISRKTAVIITAAAAAVVIAAAAIWHIFGTVTVAGTGYSRYVTEIDLSGAVSASDIDALTTLKKLQRADLTGTNLTPAQYERLTAALPSCRIVWDVPLGERRIASTAQALTLTADTAPDELQNIRYLTALTSLDATEYPLCDGLYGVTAGLPDETRGYDYRLKTTLYGKEVTSDMTSLDLSEQDIRDTAEFYEKLRFFPGLATVYAGDCAVPDEEMDALNRAFPDTKIVWLVEFGIWQVRTDIKVFSSLIGGDRGQKMTQDGYFPLVNYCTDLVALDLGHNLLTDISGFYKLTNLEIFLLPDANITDISVFRYFPKLHYVEMFNCTKLEDLSPLGDCANLEEIEMQNLGFVKNLSALTKCKKLKMLFARSVFPTDCKWQDISDAMPDCWINTTAKPAFGGWRSTDKNQMIKTAFNHWDKIVEYNNWDDVTYSEPVDLAPKHW